MEPPFEEMKVRVGERIAALRRAAGLSQDDLAALAKTSRSFVFDLERGKKSPGLETLAKIAGALKVDIGKLLEPATARNPARGPPKRSSLAQRLDVISRSAPESEVRRFETMVETLAQSFFAPYRGRAGRQSRRKP